MTSFLDEILLRQKAALQQFGIAEIVEVTEEPISLSDAYGHLRIDADSSGSDDDAWLSDIGIPGARAFCESYLGRSLGLRTMEWRSDAFPTVVVYQKPFVSLPFGPVQEIVSVTYQAEEEVVDSNGDPVLDSNGDAETEVVDATLDTADYTLDPHSVPSRLIPEDSWPTSVSAYNGVKIRYVAGYAATPDTAHPAVMPRMARAAMMVMLEHLYVNRGGGAVEIPQAVFALLDLVPGRERLGMA